MGRTAYTPSPASATKAPDPERPATGLEACRSGPCAPAVLPLRPRLRRQFRQHALNLAVPGQHPLETSVQRLRDIRPPFQTGKQHRRRLAGGKAVTARFAAELAVTRGIRRTEDDALAFQHPGITPPQRLGLAPGAVEQHDALDVFQDGALMVLDLALAVDGDDIPVGIEVGDL